MAFVIDVALCLGAFLSGVEGAERDGHDVGERSAAVAGPGDFADGACLPAGVHHRLADVAQQRGLADAVAADQYVDVGRGPGMRCDGEGQPSLRRCGAFGRHIVEVIRRQQGAAFRDTPELAFNRLPFHAAQQRRLCHVPEQGASESGRAERDVAQTFKDLHLHRDIEPGDVLVVGRILPHREPVQVSVQPSQLKELPF